MECVRSALIALACALGAAIPAFTPNPVFAADESRGAQLVQDYGCAGCHGTFNTIPGGRSDAELALAIEHPRAPMPTYNLSHSQVADIVAYIGHRDAATKDNRPTVTFQPRTPTDETRITVHFHGTPPKHVSVVPIMQMGGSATPGRAVRLVPETTNPSTFTGHIVFSMGGSWTVRVNYDGHAMDVPLNVGS
jgi:hypothetical protein